MDIILVSKKHGESRNFRLTPFKMFALTSIFVLLPFGVGVSGYFAAQFLDSPLFSNAIARAWHTEISDQRKELDAVSKEAEEQVQAMTVRMAEMQARLIRLDALGERLMDAARLKGGEFDFSSVPPVGGPLYEEPGEAYGRPDFLVSIDQLAREIESKERQLDVLDSILIDQTRKKSAFLAGRPVGKGWMSSRFGRRSDPFTGRLAMHKGVDFAGKEGSDILATGSGVVTWAEERYGYGLMVEINHGDGFITRYGHAAEIVVSVGDIVTAGHVVAKMGNTGRSTGPHVHYEVLKHGNQVDPARYVNRVRHQ